jgi:prepilin-type N-terminal cleavage/methylation domain-containing protein
MNRHTKKNNHGFTIIEILVVIAIIALLAGILLASLGTVQDAAKKTQTTSLLQAFARACDEYSMVYDRFPGILPDTVLGQTGGTYSQITPTQNTLLELMGGARVKNSNSTPSVVTEYDNFGGIEYLSNSGVTDPSTGTTWWLKFDRTRFGEGPWISGLIHAPFFSPKSRDIRYTPFDSGNAADFELPTLVDSWDTPVIFLRAIRDSGPIIDDPLGSNPNYRNPQYELPNIDPFFEDALNKTGSLLSIDAATGQTTEDRLAWLTLLLVHPTFWEDPGDGSAFSNGVAWGAVRGRFLLISAGPDTAYMEAINKELHVDQAINPSDLFGNLLGSGPTGGEITPKMMESFDDVVVYGGA